MVKNLGDYIREAEEQRNLEKSHSYMSHCQHPFSPPLFEPYSNYWDDYEPPPYSSNWDNCEPLQVQEKEEESDIDEVLIKFMEQTNERFDRFEKKMEKKMDQAKEELDSLKNLLSKVIDMATTQLAQENLSLQIKSTLNEEVEQYKESIPTSDEGVYMENNLEEETLKKDEETPTEGSQVKIIAPTDGGQIETIEFIDESICEEIEKDTLVQDLEKEEEAPNFGQIVLTIGDAVIEVHRGKVTLKSGKEEDVIKALNSSENFSSLTSHYFDYVVETNISSDLKMQVLLEKFLILQDPSIVVDGDKITIPHTYEVHPPIGKRKNNVNHMVKKLRRCSALDVKFALGEPPD